MNIEELELKVNQLELIAEDLEAAHLWLDGQKVPRFCDKTEAEFSIVGRIIRLIDETQYPPTKIQLARHRFKMFFARPDKKGGAMIDTKFVGFTFWHWRLNRLDSRKRFKLFTVAFSVGNAPLKNSKNYYKRKITIALVPKLFSYQSSFREYRARLLGVELHYKG